MSVKKFKDVLVFWNENTYTDPETKEILPMPYFELWHCSHGFSKNRLHMFMLKKYTDDGVLELVDNLNIRFGDKFSIVARNEFLDIDDGSHKVHIALPGRKEIDGDDEIAQRTAEQILTIINENW